MDLYYILQAPDVFLVRSCYLIVVSFAHLPANAAVAAVVPFLLSQLPKRRPGQEAWLGIAERACSHLHDQSVFDFCSAAHRVRTTKKKKKKAGARAIRDVNGMSLILGACRGEKSVGLGPLFPRWLLVPFCSLWDSSRSCSLLQRGKLVV